MQTIAFWITATGDVFAKYLPSGPVHNVYQSPVGTSPAAVDIVADWNGVYWADSANAIVAGWRALQDDVVLLAYPAYPTHITVRNAFEVVWSEGGELRSTSK